MKTMFSIALTVLMAAPIMLTGCDRNVSETKHEVRTPDGSVHQETKTVREDAAGNVSVDKEKKTVINNP